MKRYVMQALAAGAEYSMLACWGGIAGLATLMFYGWLTAKTAFFYAWMLNTTFVLLGVGLFLAAAALRRIRFPLVIIGILGGTTAAWLAHWLMRAHLYHLVVNARPAILFFWLWYFAPVAFTLGFLLMAFLFGTVLLPRHVDFKTSARLRWFHAPVLVLALLGAPSLLLSARPKSRVPPSPDIVMAKWVPGPEPLTVEAFDMHLTPRRGGLIPEPESFNSRGYINLRDEEVQRLRSAGVTGHLKVWGEMGGNPDSRAIIIMYQQLDAPFSFLGPGQHTDVIYLQTPQGWQKLPPDAGESGHAIRLYVPDGQPNLTGMNGWEPAMSW